MIICIQSILSKIQVDEVVQLLSSAHFVDGRLTAGWHARLVKHNLQVDAEDAILDTTRATIERALLDNELFRLAARPKQLSPVLFNQYSEGMGYGSHIDDAHMNGLRSDLSYTLFLSQPKDYEGGELVMDMTHGEQAYKLEAGDLILYPSTFLHRVEPVSRGVRLAAVGWAQSVIRRTDQREILFDLESSRLRLFQREGKTAEFDLLSKSVSNLQRMWNE